MRISDEDVKDIRFKLETVRKLFDYALRADDNSYDNKKSYTDVDIRPENYYQFTFLDKHIEIRRTARSVNYHIRLYNFIPDWDLLPFNFSSQVDPNLSENSIGCWSDFNSCLSVFIEIVKCVMEYKIVELF